MLFCIAKALYSPLIEEPDEDFFVFTNAITATDLTAEEEIPPRTYVGEYTGIVRKNNRRYFTPMNNYCYEYPFI